jgi:hypothetical protein
MRRPEAARLRRAALGLLAAGIALPKLVADSNPPPSQSANAVSPPYAATTLNAPFPDATYGADHGGSSLSLTYPFASLFGNIDHARGVITYACAPFVPRNSEGVYGLDVWLEQEDSSGNWSAAGLNGGLADNRTSSYQPVNTPNPGPSPSYAFTWTFNQVRFPPNTNYRVFVYVYLYNQGGGSQGDFYAASTVGNVNSGSANDAPRVSWTPSFGSTNPTQVQAGQSYVISADGQDDNGNLATVSINKNGSPFAYAGGGNGNSGNSQNPTSDSPGTAVFTAWAGDGAGAQSSTLSWTVRIAKGAQAAVTSAPASLVFYTTAFTPGEFGGSGSGAWQFVVSGYTNWTGGNDTNAGTELSPGNVWSPTWMPPAPGTYTFWIARDGDGSYTSAVSPSSYALTVTPAVPVGSFDGIAPTSLARGQILSGSGWAADAQSGASLSQVQILIDNGAGGSFLAAPGGSRPDVQAANLSGAHWSPANLSSAGWSFTASTAALSAGSHTLSAVAIDSAYGVATTLGSKSFTVTAAAQAAVTISPAAATINPGQSLTFTAGGGSGTGSFLWSGSAGGSGPSATVTFPAAGSHTVTVIRAGDANFLPSAPASAAITVLAPAPPTATLTATPATGAAPVAATVSWTTANATAVSVTGTGLASSLASGSQGVGLPSPGHYTYSLSATGPGGSAAASASVTVTTPLYTLTTLSNGNGTVTPGGTYPLNTIVTVSAVPGPNASFSGWTGSLSGPANPLSVTLTGNIVLYANFSSLQAQTITFAPPATAVFPGPGLTLSATATSGLPVSFSVLSGPGQLTGAQLTPTGPGPVVVQANQVGNAQWLPAPPVDGAIQFNRTIEIARIRFNLTGRDRGESVTAPADDGRLQPAGGTPLAAMSKMTEMSRLYLPHLNKYYVEMI